MSSPQLLGPELPPRSGTVKRVVIFLHGYGSNGADLLGLAPMMEMPDTQYLGPNGPTPIPLWSGGYEWFDLSDRDPVRMARDIKIAAPILNGYIDAQIARFGIADKDIALVGFSQGSMMALFTALRRPNALGAVVAFSGAMRGGETLAAEITARPPVCIVHGMLDEVVPFQSLAIAETALKEHGVPFESHARPKLGHSIDEEGIEIATTFLKKSFGL